MIPRPHSSRASTAGYPRGRAGSSSTHGQRCGGRHPPAKHLFTGPDEWEADNFSPMLGVNLFRLEPGEPNSLYHWETEAEAFFIISGEALLIVEGQERPLKEWDFAFCPPKNEHVIVGAGTAHVSGWR